jgi:exodeoxyribonuclease VII large subunit
MEYISLHTLHLQIKEKINASFPGVIWIIAEISEIRTTRAGHCYLELIEKSSNDDQIVAKARGTIWSFTFRMLKPYFETTTGQSLQAGLKALLKVSVEFQELYGYSLNVKDIDPNYTLGDLEQKRRATINQLKEDGVFEMNKETWLNPVPQKIAIISSPTAAGYQDFINQLTNNAAGFKVYYRLFPATMQGEEAEQSIIEALEKIYNYEQHFDAVVLIRGGGSTTDLMCFDSYLLALNIAQFPLPVLTGIGHDRDVSVADMVAHTQLKTPTAVADFIIQGLSTFTDHLEGLQTALSDIATRTISNHKHVLELLAQKFPPLILQSLSHKRRKLHKLASTFSTSSRAFVEWQHRHLQHLSDNTNYQSLKVLKGRKQDLGFLQSKLKLETKAYCKSAKQRLYILQKTNELSDPKQLLHKGYSITYKNATPVKELSELTVGDDITTRIQNGIIISTIKDLKKK